MNKIEFITNKNILKHRGIIFKHGRRHNLTDCEHHFIYYHVPSGEIRDFNGTLYDDDFVEDIYSFCIGFGTIEDRLDPDKIVDFYTSE